MNRMKLASFRLPKKTLFIYYNKNETLLQGKSRYKSVSSQ